MVGRAHGLDPDLVRRDVIPPLAEQHALGQERIVPGVHGRHEVAVEVDARSAAGGPDGADPGDRAAAEPEARPGARRVGRACLAAHVVGVIGAEPVAVVDDFGVPLLVDVDRRGRRPLVELGSGQRPSCEDPTHGQQQRPEHEQHDAGREPVPNAARLVGRLRRA